MNRTPCMGVGGAGFGNQKGHGEGHYHQHQVGFRRPAGATGSAGPRGAHRSSGHRHRCAHVAVVPAARAPADCLISPLPHAPPLHLPHAYAPPLAPARTTSRSIGTSHHFPRLTSNPLATPRSVCYHVPCIPIRRACAGNSPKLMLYNDYAAHCIAAHCIPLYLGCACDAWAVFAGPEGDQGPRGPAGVLGPVGPQGPKGPTGSR